MKNEIDEIIKNNSPKKLYLKENKLVNTNISNKINSITIDNKSKIKLIKEKYSFEYKNKNKNIFPCFKTYIYNHKNYKKNHQLNTIKINKNQKSFSRNEYIIKDKFNIPLLSKDNILYNSFDTYITNNSLFSNNIYNIKNSKTIYYDNNKANLNSLFEKNHLKNKKLLKRKSVLNTLSIYNNNKNTFITSSPKIPRDPENIILNNFEKKLNKLHKNNSTLSSGDLLYNKKYKYAVFDPVNVLNYFELKTHARLFEKEKSLNKFLITNREISKKNIILNFIKTELNHLCNKETIQSNFIYNKKKDLRRNEIDFEFYKNDQKRLCRKMDRLLFLNLKENRAIIEHEYNINYDMHLIRENIKKLLAHIDEYRIFGKFINEVLGGDTTRFKKKIYPIKSDKELKLNYDLLASNTIDNYSCFLNENNEFENDENFIKENEFIKNPNKIFEKFNEMREEILLYIKNKDKIKDDIKIFRKQNNTKINILREKYTKLKNEYVILKLNYEQEINEINNLIKKKNKKRNEFYSIIIDLYYYTNKLNLRKINNNKNENIFDYIENINKNIFEIQNILDGLLMNLNNYEENDKRIFHEIIDKRKEEIRQFKKDLVLQRFINKSSQKKENTRSNKDKILFISRKTEAPYTKPKRIKKKIVLNQKQIEIIENQELLNYDD